MRATALASLFLVAVSGVAGGAGPSHRTPAAVGQARVFDANGADVGTFLGWPLNVALIAVLRDDSGILLHLDHISGGLRSWNGFIFFEESDCRGQGWLQAPLDVWLTGPVFAPGQFVVGAAPADLRTIEFQSRTIEPLFLCENVAGERTDHLAPLRFVSEDELGFSLPFAGPLVIDRAIPGKGHRKEHLRFRHVR
jgi:hypothetical protein